MNAVAQVIDQAGEEAASLPTLSGSAPSTPLTPLAAIFQAVANGASIEMVERLMVMQERMEANEARKAYVAAMAEFKAEPITIRKNKHVGFESRRVDSKTDYNHATLDEVVAAVAPSLARVGLSYRWKTEQIESGQIVVTCIVRHTLGHSEETMLRGSPDSSGNKNSIQAVGSTVSYLSRYTLMAALGLAAAEQDDDGRGASSDTIDMDMVSRLQDGLTKAQADIERFCKYMGVSSLAEIKTRDLPKAWESIHAKRAAVEKGEAK